jgi:general secretion pathway protein H
VASHGTSHFRIERSATPHGRCCAIKATAFDERGYTMMETLVVLTLVAIIGSMFLVYTGPREKTPFAMAQIIAMETRSARQSAIAAGRISELIFDLNQRLIVNKQRRSTIELPRHLKFTMTTAGQLVSDKGAASVLFFPDGSTTGAEIAVSDTVGSVFSVHVFWLTGATSVKGQR